MKHVAGMLVFLAMPWVASCGGGGTASASSTPLIPRGGQCAVAPKGECTIDESRSDQQRFAALNDLSKQLLEPSHPLHDSTLDGAEMDRPIGDHVQTIAVIMSTWDVEAKSDEPIAKRRSKGGDLHNVVVRLRCAADRLIALGATAKVPDLVCWSMELWRVGRAYVQMASK